MLDICTSDRPGPVLIDLPDDLQREFINPNKLKSYKPKKKSNKNNINLKKINQFFNLLQSAKRPTLIIGMSKEI